MQISLLRYTPKVTAVINTTWAACCVTVTYVFGQIWGFGLSDKGVLSQFCHFFYSLNPKTYVTVTQQANLTAFFRHPGTEPELEV